MISNNHIFGKRRHCEASSGLTSIRVGACTATLSKHEMRRNRPVNGVNLPFDSCSSGAPTSRKEGDVLSPGRWCRPVPLVCSLASGFQRCNVPVHKDNILARFGGTRVKLVVIQKERSNSRRKRQDEVRDSAGRVPLSQ